MQKIEYDKLIIQPGASKSTCQVFVIDLFEENQESGQISPEANKKIFGLIEVESAPSRKVNSFIGLLIQEIKNFRPKDSGETAEAIFEKLVQKVNYKYLDLIGNKSTFGEEEAPIPKINALFLLQDGKNIYLTYRGRIFPFLIYQAKPQNYKIINISETASGKDGRGNINLFTNIVSGKMNTDDYLMLSTESILDYFSLEKICKMVSGYDPKDSINGFGSLLAESANPKTSFAVLVVKLEQARKPEPIRIPDQNQSQSQISMPQSSMDDLMKTAHNTEKMLTPSLRLNIGSGISSFFRGIKNSREEKKQIKNKAKLEYYSSQFAPPSRLGKLAKPFYWIFLAVFRTIYLILKTVVVSFFGFFRAIFNFITGKGRVPAKPVTETITPPEPQYVESKKQSPKLPRPSKALLAAAAVVLCLFASGTVFLHFKYEKESAAESLRQKVEIIQNKKNAAEASLIYNDEVGAAKLLVEADSLLAVFPQNNTQEKNAYEDIAGELGTLRDKIRHLVNIENPALLVNFSEHNPSAAVNEFIISKNNLYAFDRLASAVYKMNIETKEIINKNAPGLSLRLGFLENENSAFFYQPEKKFFNFDLNEDILKQEGVTLNENESKIDDLALYNQKLYILDAINNQIFKHTPTESGFTRGTPWIKDGTDIKNAVSFAIDGSVYLAKSNGEIVKFDNGKKTDFSYSIDPPLVSPSKIWTSPESSFVYILEPAGKRLVVLDKEGKLKAQYVSGQLTDLRDFVVLEDKKEIYLLSENQIYGIVAAHLE